MRTFVATGSLAFLVAAVCLLGGCFVDRMCFGDEDCGGGRVCGESGSCVAECGGDEDCTDGFVCDAGRCVPGSDDPIDCPDDMAAVANTFCMDIWEASRSDATESDEGADDSVALSRPGVVPWTAGIYTNPLGFNDLAVAGCEAAGKRLCTEGEWEYGCKGTDDLVYVYGNDYEPDTCSGREAEGVSDLIPMPTGAFAGCVNEWGVYDLSGNVYEHVAGGDCSTVRGGAHKSLEPQLELQCGFVPETWMPCFCSQGFRCCLTPEEP